MHARLRGSQPPMASSLASSPDAIEGTQHQLHVDVPWQHGLLQPKRGGVLPQALEGTITDLCLAGPHQITYSLAIATAVYAVHSHVHSHVRACNHTRYNRTNSSRCRPSGIPAVHCVHADDISFIVQAAGYLRERLAKGGRSAKGSRCCCEQVVC
jgi:hypothetical protein